MPAVSDEYGGSGSNGVSGGNGGGTDGRQRRPVVPPLRLTKTTTITLGDPSMPTRIDHEGDEGKDNDDV